MTAAVPRDDQPGPDDTLARRSADLAELLGHVNTCWDEERRALARQLHDSLGSSLTALTMHLALLAQQMPKEQPLLDRVAQMKTLLANIVDSNRQTQSRLWNDKLEFLGIKVALAELVGQFGTEHHLVARVSLPDEDVDYPHSHSVALLRCVEEGLRNIAAHAQATEVDVVLDDNDDEIMLTVRDNGVGPGAAHDGARERHGLRVLRERAGYLGGAVSLAPHAPAGSCLTVTLPKRQAAAV